MINEHFPYIYTAVSYSEKRTFKYHVDSCSATPSKLKT